MGICELRGILYDDEIILLTIQLRDDANQ